MCRYTILYSRLFFLLQFNKGNYCRYIKINLWLLICFTLRENFQGGLLKTRNAIYLHVVRFWVPGENGGDLEHAVGQGGHPLRVQSDLVDVLEFACVAVKHGQPHYVGGTVVGENWCFVQIYPPSTNLSLGVRLHNKRARRIINLALAKKRSKLTSSHCQSGSVQTEIIDKFCRLFIQTTATCRGLAQVTAVK